MSAIVNGHDSSIREAVEDHAMKDTSTRHPFPNSWYQVLRSDELPAGSVRSLEYFNRDLVAFRGEDGVANVLDAHCPHLGTHLGKDGKVIGNSLRCPFHGWQFDGQGRCVHIPYDSAIPNEAKTHSWPTRERNGGVLVYYHAEREAPDFEIPEVPEMDSRAWAWPRTYDFPIHAPLHEVNENLVDTGHFYGAHSFAKTTAREITMQGKRLHAVYDVEGSLLPVDRFPRLNLSIPSEMEFQLIGAGYQIDRVKTSGLELVVVSMKTPIDAHRCRTWVIFGVKKTGIFPLDLLLGWLLPIRGIAETRKEVTIWNNKRYLQAPVLCTNDGPIAAFRRWHEGLYSPVFDDALVQIRRPAEVL
jgi:nitrite reductase/ring-hydroxylating ferredoxin subunit